MMRFILFHLTYFCHKSLLNTSMQILIFATIFFKIFLQFHSLSLTYIDATVTSDGNGTISNPYKYFESFSFGLMSGDADIVLINDYIFQNVTDFIDIENSQYQIK